MSEKKQLSDVLGIDVERAIKEAEDDINDLSQQEIDKFNERREMVAEFKKDLKLVRDFSDKDWCLAMLKNSAEKMSTVQHVFEKEIHDDPISRNVTAMGELSNALNATVKSVMDIVNDEKRIAQSQEKNDLRRMEIESGGGPLLGQGKQGILGVGSNSDLLKMIKHGMIDVEAKEVKNA